MRGLLRTGDTGAARLVVERARQTRTDDDIDHGFVNGTGERWMSARRCQVDGGRGKARGMLGVVQDVTESVRARETLRRQAEALPPVSRRW